MHASVMDILRAKNFDPDRRRAEVPYIWPPVVPLSPERIAQQSASWTKRVLPALDAATESGGFPAREEAMRIFYERKSTKFDWPHYIAIRSQKGEYLRRRGTVGLYFVECDLDPHCVFRVIELGETSILLIASNGHFLRTIPVERSSKRWFSVGADMTYTVMQSTIQYIHLGENFFYLSVEKEFLSTETKTKRLPVHKSQMLVAAMPGYPSTAVQMEIVEPIIRKRILDVVYDLLHPRITPSAPIMALSATVRNDSTLDSRETLSYSYKKSNVGSWSGKSSHTIGKKVTFSTQCPGLTAANELSLSSTHEYTWGESKTEEVQASCPSTYII